jgi:hypothetical protein
MRPELPKLQLQLYERVNPSASKTAGGDLLPIPSARLDDANVVTSGDVAASA